MLGRESIYTYIIDYQFEYFKLQVIQNVGTYYKTNADLEKWVIVANQTGLSLDAWLSKDVYWQEAIYQAVSSVIEVRNKKEKEEKDSLMKQISNNQESVPYVSPFATVPKPTFQMG